MSSAEDHAAAIAADNQRAAETGRAAADGAAPGAVQALVHELSRLLGLASRGDVHRSGLSLLRSIAPSRAAHPPQTTAPAGPGGAAPAGDAAVAEWPAAGAAAAPSLDVYLLGPFCAFANDKAIEDWPNCKSRAIFKYLVVHRCQPVPKEVLMDEFWPGADADAARNNLNVAVYGLRRALARVDADFPFVLFRQGCYSFNPKLSLWVDAEAFVDRAHRGQIAEQRGETDAAIAEYRVAQAIYRSPLLVADRYEDWLLPQRQHLQDKYLKLLARLSAFHFEREEFEDCAAAAAKAIEADSCNEEAHQLLMRCYGRMGHSHLALRQYHLCVDALARELKLIPSAQTVALFQQIRHRLPV